MLESTPASVNSALQRARAGFRPSGGPDRATLPRSPHEAHVVGRFVDAIQQGDLDGMVAILTDNAKLTMPPDPFEFNGPRPSRSFSTAWRWVKISRWFLREPTTIQPWAITDRTPTPTSIERARSSCCQSQVSRCPRSRGSATRASSPVSGFRELSRVLSRRSAMTRPRARESPLTSPGCRRPAPPWPTGRTTSL
jgi:hypothetical protein